MSTPQRQKRISDQITERLQHLVLSDNLRPGDRLPPERQLADMFGVSRNSVREAIKSLEQRGILVSRPGAGTFIVDTSQADLASALGEIFARERHRLDDIFELRLLLEPQITYLAAQRITAEELENLHKIMSDYVRALRAYQPVQGIDQSFHDAIAAATGNQSVILFMEKMHDLMHESRDEALQSPVRSERSLQDHLTILDALGVHDAERAREAMKGHLEHTREIVFTSTSGE